ncbi:hypothetical protein [Streptomyces sp. MNP-20]|uniref:hypothetical protein n=1 Tax=Streptomyces sp. MNP-20 TaxID=2721165 RepID=UPI001553C632|nr:hypothetical protein [Streptomyces sp. MNP-20]
MAALEQSVQCARASRGEADVPELKPKRPVKKTTVKKTAAMEAAEARKSVPAIHAGAPPGKR